MMSLRRFSSAALAVFLACSLVSIPAVANPGNGNGQGNGGGQGNSGNHGNSGSHSDNGNHQHKSAKQKEGNDISVNVSYDRVRALAVNYGLTGYDSLPPGIAKNVARGKALPPGIAKKTVPASMLGQLPSYPGYEWRIVGDDLVLVALSTAVVTAMINGVFK
ncbi:hypothetical protein PUATCC27989T_02624 [Phytobacter ursingii]|nr:hypothetical protein PUATCC27989T_02624 [Phytobacter ursingii]